MLEVGCGPGELPQRIARSSARTSCAVDISERMVELTRARGVDARVADAEELPFENGDFDCVVAGWVLYHVPGPRAGDRRVRARPAHGRPARRVVFREDNLGSSGISSIRSSRATQLTFSADERRDAAAPLFARVERRDVEASLVFPDTASLRSFVAATIDRAHLAAARAGVHRAVPATTRHVVFVAEGAAVIRAAELIQAKRDGGELGARRAAELMLALHARRRARLPDRGVPAWRSTSRG